MYYIQTPKWDPDHPPEKLFGGKIGLGMPWCTFFGHLKRPKALILRYEHLRRLNIQLAAGCVHWLSGARRTPKRGNWPGNAVAFNWSSSGAIALVLTPESRSAYLNFGVQCSVRVRHSDPEPRHQRLEKAIQSTRFPPCLQSKCIREGSLNISRPQPTNPINPRLPSLSCALRPLKSKNAFISSRSPSNPSHCIF